MVPYDSALILGYKHTFEEKFIVHSLIFTVLRSLCALNKESHNFEKQEQQYLTNLCTKFQLHGFIRAEDIELVSNFKLGDVTLIYHSLARTCSDLFLC